jgi:tripartite-type tricarboxylate transporter receptor subunit TctC
MQVALGQPVVVEPKPGGNSTLATAMIPQAPADGCNWVMATISHVVVPSAIRALRSTGRLPGIKGES